VVSFLDKADDFYEAHYADWVPTRTVPKSERWYHAWPLWLIKSGYLWSARKHVPAESVVVEVGCGSGVTYFGKRFRMVGIDVAHSGLVKLRDIYDICLQADITEPLPLPDRSVDAVVNSFIWEHIPPETKPTVLKEWFRVLKPGGKLIVLYDVETNNPLIRRLKRRDLAMYRKLYIENEHHYGYQLPSENRALFEAAGFLILEHRGKEKTWILSPWEYERTGQWPGWPARISRVGQKFTAPPWLYPYTALVRIMDDVIGPILPMSWSRTVLSVCERT
jgi:SAM-dependent methyltransferase